MSNVIPINPDDSVTTTYEDYSELMVHKLMMYETDDANPMLDHMDVPQVSAMLGLEFILYDLDASLESIDPEMWAAEDIPKVQGRYAAVVAEITALRDQLKADIGNW